MFNPMDLTGKKIIITGASSGIGQETAIRASRLGAEVSLVARNEAALQQTIAAMEPNPGHGYYLCDLNETEAIEPLVKRIVAERGPQDGFVHSAGISKVRALKSMKPKSVEEMMRINAFAFIEFIRCLSLKQNLNDGASLVGISSVAASQGAVGQGNYAAAKSAMEGVLMPLARELAQRRIRVNAVAFSMVNTPMYESFRGYAGEAERASVEEGQRLGIIEKEDAAHMILFLLSDAVRYITGTTVPVFAGI